MLWFPLQSLQNASSHLQSHLVENHGLLREYIQQKYILSRRHILDQKMHLYTVHTPFMFNPGQYVYIRFFKSKFLKNFCFYCSPKQIFMRGTNDTAAQKIAVYRIKSLQKINKIHCQLYQSVDFFWLSYTCCSMLLIFLSHTTQIIPKTNVSTGCITVSLLQGIFYY